MEFFSVLFGIVFLFCLFWADWVLLGKAGFARGWVFLIIFTGPFGWMLLILIEWPIHRELAWHRLKAGDVSEPNIASAEHYAVDREKVGEWKQAAEVFAELGRRAPSKKVADYYWNCLMRLRERMETAGIA